MTQTGVFFKPMFNGLEWHMIGNRWDRFPPALTSEPALEIKATAEGLCGDVIWS